MAQEISANGPAGMQTVNNIVKRAQEMGLEIRTEDTRFVLDVVGESDPWFVQGVSASLFASRFRNFVVARCRSQGLNLSADELDLIEAWFAAPAVSQRGASAAPAYANNQQQQAAPSREPSQASQQTPAAQAHAGQAPGPENRADRWWNAEEGHRPDQSIGPADEFPRIIRTRLRG
jgi:hypothetical protein